MKRIKASERLPEKGLIVFANVEGKKMLCVNSVVDGKMHDVFSITEPLSCSYDKIEWLDETQVPPPPNEDDFYNARQLFNEGNKIPGLLKYHAALEAYIKEHISES